MNDPLVTVLMSVYNGEKYLSEAIESILNQTYKNFEFLIIDDGSTDSSKKIVKSYNDSRIKLIENEENIGLTRSLNKGIELSKGKYIARMDADDISFPERLEKQVDFMENHEDVAVCGSWFRVIDDKGNLLSEVKTQINHEFLFFELFFKNPMGHATTIMRKSVIEHIGRYDPDYVRTQDYDLWFRIIESGYKIHNIDRILIYYRKHENMVSIVESNLQEVNAQKVIKALIQKMLFLNIYNVEIIRKPITHGVYTSNVSSFIKFYKFFKRLIIKFKSEFQVSNDLSLFMYNWLTVYEERIVLKIIFFSIVKIYCFRNLKKYLRDPYAKS